MACRKVMIAIFNLFSCMDSSKIVSQVGAAPRMHRRKVWIDRNSPFKIVWDFFILLIVIYTIIIVPLELGFQTVPYSNLPPGFVFSSPTVDSVDSYSDLFFFIDLCLTFMTSHPDKKNGREEWGFNKIATEYLKSFFLIDLLSSIPFDSLAVIFASSSSSSGKQATNISTIFKLLKIPRLLRISRIFMAFENMSSAWVWRILRLLFTVVIMVHVLASILGAIWVMPDSRWFENNASIETVNSWYSRYAACVHMISSILIGGGTMPPTTVYEQIYETIVLFIGTATQAGIIGSITMVIENTSAATMDYRKTMDVVNESMRSLKCEPELMRDIRNYFDFSFAVYGHQAGPQDDWFQMLTPGLRQRILVQKYSSIVRNSPLFAQAPADFIHVILGQMKTMLYIPGEMIIKNGSRGKHMYFVVQGVCAVQTKNNETGENEVKMVMQRGSFFGELALFDEHCRRTADVESLTYTDLSALSKAGLAEAFEDFPKQNKFFKLIAELRKENHGKKNTVEIIKLAKEQLNITDDPSDDYDIYAEEKRMKQSAYMRRGSASGGQFTISSPVVRKMSVQNLMNKNTKKNSPVKTVRAIIPSNDKNTLSEIENNEEAGFKEVDEYGSSDSDDSDSVKDSGKEDKFEESKQKVSASPKKVFSSKTSMESAKKSVWNLGASVFGSIDRRASGDESSLSRKSSSHMLRAPVDKVYEDIPKPVKELPPVNKFRGIVASLTAQNKESVVIPIPNSPSSSSVPSRGRSIVSASPKSPPQEINILENAFKLNEDHSIKREANTSSVMDFEDNKEEHMRDGL